MVASKEDISKYSRSQYGSSSSKKKSKRSKKRAANKAKQKTIDEPTKDSKNPNKDKEQSLDDKVKSRKSSKTESKAEKKATKKEKKAHKRDTINHTRRRYVVAACILVIAVAVSFLYPTTRSYYESIRQEQRKEAQIQAINERNAKIQEQNNYLQTDEGVENQARKSEGYVKDGEEGVVITNSGEKTDSSTQLPEQVDINNIQAPKTWYYNILDTVFNVHV